MRFGNIAGNDLNRCDGSVRADFIETSEEFRESIMRKRESGNNFKVGSEVEVSGEVSANADAVKVPVVGTAVGVGANVGASTTIPPLSQSSSSNSQVMLQLLEGIESRNQSVTRAGFTCYEHEFEITEYQHPTFASQFLSAVDSLESCLLPDSSSPQDSLIIPGKTSAQDDCAIKFFKNYGTHYIKAARFGSKMSILTLVDSKTASLASKDEVEKCAANNNQWSAIGIVGGGSNTAGCIANLSESTISSTKVVEEEIVVTVGSRPKVDVRAWADQMGKPEIVHKTIAPISDIFTTDFMKELSFKENGDATIKESLETYLFNYCGLFRSECNYVVDKLYCPKDYCSGSISVSRTVILSNPIGEEECGTYTGSVDQDFLPHGQGTLRLEGGRKATGIWVRGCAPDCDVYPKWQQLVAIFLPGNYILATQDQVTDHKEWILERLEKWAVAKFEKGSIYGRGHGGQIVTEEKEDVNFKHVILCKNEVKPTDDNQNQTRTGKAMEFLRQNIVQGQIPPGVGNLTSQ